MFNANFKTLRELCSSGKSGSFFYYTSDGNFMLKTIRRDEFKIMKGMLRAYYEHITDENPDSLISRIYGLHKVIFYRKKHKMQKKIAYLKTIDEDALRKLIQKIDLSLLRADLSVQRM